jgi:2-keto-4-pentenoate hydratase/2-oxohepta-3-ene-1,7-dioic acid hydratase in catechol pathway
MKLVVADLNGIAALALVDESSGSARLIPESLVPRGGDPLMLALRDSQCWARLQALDASADPALTSVALEALKLRAPLRPGKLICLASNYASHMREAKLVRRSVRPWLFMKPSSAVIGPGGTIRLPFKDAAVDWEVELCAVIGLRCRDVAPEHAMSFVAGFTVGNDISLRTVDEMRPDDSWDHFFSWLSGKWHDSFSPIGPWLVSRDELLPQLPLQLSLSVNGEPRQDGSTSDMIFGLAESIAFISTIMTLDPGDVVMTGTPSGVGATDGTFLKPGDVVEAKIHGIGTLQNRVGAPLSNADTR